jgi:hypothetical protein
MRQLQRVAQRKLATTIANLIIGGIQLSMNIIAKEATLIGKTQYPNRLALWKKLLNKQVFTLKIRGSWR